MKHIIGVLAIGMLAFASCKKEKPEEVFDPTIPPANPDFGARVATITEPDSKGNKFTVNFFTALPGW